MKRINMRFGGSGRRVLLMVLAVMVLVTSAVVGGIYAKYVYDRGHLGVAGTTAFYFESDLLSGDGGSYILNAGTKSVSFTVSNAADALRFSDEDISYTVTTSDGSFSENEKVTEMTGSLTKAQNSTHTITLYGLVDGGTYTVTAHGEADFEETLTATFTVTTDPAEIYMHTDTSNEAYVVLTIWTKNLSGMVSITVPDDLIPDNTDPKMADLKTGEDITNLSLEKYASVSYRFFVGEGTQSPQFTVTLTDGEGNFHTVNVEEQLQ